MTQEQKEKAFFRRLKSKYRLVVMNDNTFEEKLSLKLSPLNLFILVGSTTIFLIIIVISTIAFTPLREYIPGYADVNMRKKVISLVLKADSLETELVSKDIYIKNIQNIITGKTIGKPVKQTVDSTKKYNAIDFKPSKEDLLLREQIESQDQYNLSLGTENTQKNNINSFFFFTPLKGLLSNSFNIAEAHYGVDVVAPENEAIKATLDGTVILSIWTAETGYVIQIQHENNLISVYKHNSALLKKAGEYVKAGETIAIIGNSGELTNGPHLHFELWYNGTPINPQDYMVF